MTEIFGVPTQALMGQLMLGLVNGSFYAMLSLGLAVIFGMLNIVNFAHGSLLMAAMFVAWLLAERVAWPSGIVGLALQCGLGGGFGLVIYGLVAGLAGVPEARQLISGMARRLPGKA